MGRSLQIGLLTFAGDLQILSRYSCTLTLTSASRCHIEDLMMMSQDMSDVIDSLDDEGMPNAFSST